MTDAMTATQDLPKQYDHVQAQDRWYKFWEERGYFHSEPDPEREPYTIVIPPPNVTGALHLGHALNNTLQDILIRFKRMQGYNTLWMPGTDHAGIATQAVVERRLLEEEGKSRHELGPEGLVERIWQWKEQYEARILNQLKQLGCSCDWQRSRFTLDDVCARAVRETFFRLFKDGKIYRGKRLVNWDTYLQTAVSDDEVFHETVQGHFWHFRYPVIDRRPGEPTHVTIATTRPETMLGDTAVAVHPDPAAALDKAEADLKSKLSAAPAKEKTPLQTQLDAIVKQRETRLTELEQLRDMAKAGRKVLLPLLDREIPLVADEWAKPELGSGCVKITPAHDPNDYEVWQRHPEIGAINILNPDGTLNENAGPYQGLSIPDSRKRVVADLEEKGLLVDVEDREIDLAHSDRSKTPIEPYLADQWFVKMDELAQSAMDAVIDGRVKIVPNRYAKGYLDWLSEKRDWPIGRQLWWGHRIPVWTFRMRLKSPSEHGAKPHEIEPTYAQMRDERAQALMNYLNAANVNQDDYVIEPVALTEVRICTRTTNADYALSAFAKFHESSEWAEHIPGEPVQAILREVPGFERATAAANLVQDYGYLKRDTDVLDTWFSSALWPHSTLGWPEDTPELSYYYPTSTLITSRDIITLWVARMVLTGLYNVGEVPFREVFIHPKILDGYGETMSKSKGNGVDPLDVIEKFGADSLRFGLAYMTTETQDVRMPVEFECPHCRGLINQTKKNRTLPRVQCEKCGGEFSTQWAQTDKDKKLPRGAVVSERFELGRNFSNKLWNASRFALMNLAEFQPGPVRDDELAVEDRWLLSRFSTVTAAVTEALDGYRYADAARTLYDFAWDDFCSFYVEMAKNRLQSDETRPLAQRVLAHALDVLLRLLHPMIPFLTEEVWQLLGVAAPERGLAEPEAPAESIMIAPWPAPDAARQDPAIERQFAQFQAVLAGLREIRSSQNIPPREPIEFSLRAEAEIVDLLKPMEPYFESMAGAKVAAWGPEAAPPDNAAGRSLPGIELFVDMKDFIDVEAEIARNEKERDKITGFIAGKEKKLANEQFVSRAPVEVVEKERASLTQLKQELASLDTTLEKLRTAQS